MSTAAHETSLGVDHRKLAMWVFLGSEFLFFGAFISAYLLYVRETNGGPGVELFDIAFTSISSFILLMSSLTMVLAHNAHAHRDMRRTRIWLLATAFLGMVFIGGQAFEFTTFYNEGLTLTTSPFSSSFFVLTGLHGALRPGGRLLLGFFDTSSSAEPLDHAVTRAYAWPRDVLASMLAETGFRIEQVEHRTDPGARPHAAIHARRP